MSARSEIWASEQKAFALWEHSFAPGGSFNPASLLLAYHFKVWPPGNHAAKTLPEAVRYFSSAHGVGALFGFSRVFPLITGVIAQRIGKGGMPYGDADPFGQPHGSLFDAGGDGEKTVITTSPVDALACRHLYPSARCFSVFGPVGLLALDKTPINHPLSGFVLDLGAAIPGIFRAAQEALKQIPGAALVFRQGTGPAMALGEEIKSRMTSEDIPGLEAAWKDWRRKRR